MALSFPRDLPICTWTENGSFTLERSQARAPTGGGSPDVVEIAPALWAGEWGARIFDRATFASVDAWIASLRGGLRLFKGRPNRHKWPLAYPRGFAGLTVSGSPFSGSGNLNAIGANRDTVTIDALPIGLVLGVGDWFSIPAGSRQHLHRVLEGGTASGGGAVTVTCEPIIRPDITTGIAVLLEAPYCDMNMPEPPRITRYPTGGGEVSFKGRQVLI